jgi:hypothetical protein
MLDYLALICLLALCLGHYYLIRGCMAIQTEAGSLHALLEGKMAETNNLLNEMAEILDEGIGTQPTQSPIAQSSNPMMAILTAFLNNKATMQNHGSQEQTGEIREIDPTQTNTEENEHSGFRTELADSERTNAGLV